MSDKSFPLRAYTVLAIVSNSYSVLKGMFPRVPHPCASLSEDSDRLACVRPAASVRSEPGSNSQVDFEQICHKNCICAWLIQNSFSICSNYVERPSTNPFRLFTMSNSATPKVDAPFRASGQPPMNFLDRLCPEAVPVSGRWFLLRTVQRVNRLFSPSRFFSLRQNR